MLYSYVKVLFPYQGELTALHKAAISGNSNSVQALLDSENVDVNAKAKVRLPVLKFGTFADQC